MKTGLFNKETFMERYPEQKPVCLNYATVRADMLALIEEVELWHSLYVRRTEELRAQQQPRYPTNIGPSMVA